MDPHKLSRRDVLRQGSAAFAGLALCHAPWLTHAFPTRSGEEIIPFLERPQPPSADLNVLKWDELDAWITPNVKFFHVAPYQKPLGPVIDEKDWKLEITVKGVSHVANAARRDARETCSGTGVYGSWHARGAP
jgi:hypothetical protein